MTLQTTLMAFNGTDTAPIVRVAWNDHVRIKQALDIGVEGIMAPMVRNVAECRALMLTGLFRQRQHPTNKGALDTIIARAQAAARPCASA